MTTALLFNIIGTVLAIFVIIVLAFKGVHVTLLGAVAALIIALTAGIGINTYLTTYAAGFATIIRNTMFLYTTSMIFSGVMLKCGYAHAIAYFVADTIGAKYTATVCVIATAIFTIGGISTGGYVIMYSIGLVLCSRMNYDRRFLAAAVMCPAWSFIGIMPMGATLHNGLLVPGLGVQPSAGFVPGVVCAAVMFLLDVIYLEWYCRKTQKNGGTFNAWDMIKIDEKIEHNLPKAWKAFIPIIMVLVLFNAVRLSLPVCLAILSLYVCAVEFKRLGKNWWKCWQDGFVDALLPIAGVAAMGGIATVLAETSIWTMLMNFISTSTLNPYILVLILVAILCIPLGSATTVINTAMPTLQALAPSFIARGATLSNIARATSIFSQGWSALPHAGGIVACFQMFKTNHKESWPSVGMVCCYIPIAVGLLVGLPLFLLGL